jgi:protein-disulfide isomerase
LAKVQRKVVRRGRRQGLSTEVIIMILGGAVIVAVVLAVMFWPKAEGLTMCGSVPCPAKGDPNAPVKVIEVSSFVCSHCRDYALATEPKLEEQYIKTGKVYYIAHVLGFDSEAQRVAAAALCANDQGKYWEYSAVLFKNQGTFDSNSLSLYAQQVGLDTQVFVACVNAGKRLKDAQTASNTATAAGVNATPSFFINGKLVVGNVPLTEFQARIEEALKASQ